MYTRSYTINRNYREDRQLAQKEEKIIMPQWDEGSRVIRKVEIIVKLTKLRGGGDSSSSGGCCDWWWWWWWWWGGGSCGGGDNLNNTGGGDGRGGGGGCVRGDMH